MPHFNRSVNDGRPDTVGRYGYLKLDFASIGALFGKEYRTIPVWLAKSLGLPKILLYQAVPAILESLKSGGQTFQNKQCDLRRTIDP